MNRFSPDLLAMLTFAIIAALAWLPTAAHAGLTMTGID
jgi:hypothetical protein